MRLKRFFITTVFVVAFAATASAQEHRASVGVIADFGEKCSMVGPHIKYLFTNNISSQGMVLFGRETIAIGIEGSYNASFPGVNGLNWNAGVGAQLLGIYYFCLVIFRPSLGLEYNIPKTSLNVGLDWRPAIVEDIDFVPARFGLTLRYSFQIISNL